MNAFALYVPKTTGQGGHAEDIQLGLTQRQLAAMEGLLSRVTIEPVDPRGGEPAIARSLCLKAWMYADILLATETTVM